ncbi:Calcium-transporting ATPase [Actinidia chinensis var. chinensis]|uniref:Calcium-transporting ATPase n=1 Tax=Actinidia chinensis var. chinensis TaxID=1590841 RepID=A0A2R6QLZ4_ACTCC|nr:Calcium-transporting ATPase [Actinidia chinensis var. chinensis]
MSKVNSGEVHIDLESQSHGIVKDGNTCLANQWRTFFVTLYVSQAFIASAKTRLLDHDGASPATPSAIDSSGTDGGNVELSNTSTSPQVSLFVHSDGADERNKHDKELQNAEMARIMKLKDLNSLRDFGGVQGFAEALDTDLENGLPCDEDDLCCRRTTCPQSEPQALKEGFFYILLNACNKYIILLLLLLAALSLGFGIEEEGLETGWYEGIFIINGIIVLIAVPVACKYRSLWRLTRKKKLQNNGEIAVKVWRGQNQHKISIFNVVLGDIVCLTVGDHIPADGLFISGEPLKLDDELQSTIDEENPFMFYGTKVINGNGRMLATSIGKDTMWGEMMSNVTNAPNKETPLQVQLDRLNTRIQITGLLITIIILVEMFLRFKFETRSDVPRSSPDLKRKPTAIKEFIDAIQKVVMKPRAKCMLASLTIFLVGISEGLPLMVTLAINHWNRKAFSGRTTAHGFFDCIAMGSVTAICTDLNQMEVDIFYNSEEIISKASDIDPEVGEALCIGIGTPTMRLQGHCSSIEDALLSWASLNWGMKINNLKQECTVDVAKELNSDEGGCGVLVRRNSANGESMESHWRGPAQTILAMCSHYCDRQGARNAINDPKRKDFEQIIEIMKAQQLKTIAFGYKQTNARSLEEKGLILLGILGLKRPFKRAIEACKEAGVAIKLVSGCNALELESVTIECGLNRPNSDSVVFGEDFRSSTHEERMEMVDRICVLGNSLPSDKLLLVKCLKERGYVVAWWGARTNETPAIREADVGITMGNSSSEMARESSSIIIPDGDFNFLVNIMKCGRCAHDNIQKFIQLELIMTIAWLLITIIMTSCFGDAPLSAIQYLWVCLIVAVLGGLALLTELPTENLMKKPPVRQTDALITRTMWRNIVLQALYQAAILVTFQFKAQAVLGISQKVSRTMVFNSFVLCQVFNWFNAREPEKKNVFKGSFQNCWFWVAIVVTMVLQGAYTKIADILDRSGNLNLEQWAICFLIGALSWVVDWAGKSMSDSMAGRLRRQRSSNTGSISMVPSASSESLVNLELPLINDSSL